MPKEVPVSTGIKIEDGKHTGTLVRLEENTRTSQKDGKEYTYIDYFIELNEGGKKVELKSGVPSRLGTDTKLGKLLAGLGVDLKPLLTGKTADLEPLFAKLIGKKVTFITLAEVSGRGKFARVVEGSVKPV